MRLLGRTRPTQLCAVDRDSAKRGCLFERFWCKRCSDRSSYRQSPSPECGDSSFPENLPVDRTQPVPNLRHAGLRWFEERHSVHTAAGTSRRETLRTVIAIIAISTRTTTMAIVHFLPASLFAPGGGPPGIFSVGRIVVRTFAMPVTVRQERSAGRQATYPHSDDRKRIDGRLRHLKLETTHTVGLLQFSGKSPDMRIKCFNLNGLPE